MACTAREAIKRPGCTVTRGFLAVALVTLTLTVGSWAASKERVLYSFQGGADGSFPMGGVISDAQGNLYGATNGGDLGTGNVYKLTHNKDGSWTNTVLHSFEGEPVDGAQPMGSLVFDSQGNLYGTTSTGGIGVEGEGTVFKLTPIKKGPWKETILHTFNCLNTNDGCGPQSSVIFDSAGNLYGTTLQGGGGDNSTFCQNGCGTVFELSPNKDGSWTESLIHTFPDGSGGTPDGQNPYASLIMDSAGNLYGTTWAGGPDDEGIIFRLAPAAKGKWKETVLFHFHDLVNNPPDGANPYASLLMDKDGNLYGTTRDGGGKPGGGGTVFKLTPTAKGAWKETVIHAFSSTNDGGYLPLAGLIADSVGNLYSVTPQDGESGDGVVFKLSPNSNGSWTETVLYGFQGGSDGSTTFFDRLLIDAAGNLYGTTEVGGLGDGVVFKITP